MMNRKWLSLFILLFIVSNSVAFATFTRPNHWKNCEETLLSAEEQVSGLRGALKLLGNQTAQVEIGHILSLKLTKSDWATFLEVAIAHSAKPVLDLIKANLDEVFPEPGFRFSMATLLGLLEDLDTWTRLSQDVDFGELESEERVRVAAVVRGTKWYEPEVLAPLALTDSEKAGALHLLLETLPEDHPFLSRFFEQADKVLLEEGVGRHEDQIRALSIWRDRFAAILFTRLLGVGEPALTILNRLSSAELLEFLTPIAYQNFHGLHPRENRSVLKERFSALSQEDLVRFLALSLAQRFSRSGDVSSAKQTYLFPDNAPSRSDRLLFIQTLLENIDSSLFVKRDVIQNLIKKILYPASVYPRLVDLRVIEDILYRKDPLASILNHSELDISNPSDLNGWHVEANETKPGLRFLFEDYARSYPERMSSEFGPRTFWEPTRDSELARRLITEFYDLDARRFEGEDLPQDTLDFVCRLAGLEVEKVRGSKTERNPLAIYRSLLRLHTHFRTPFFEGFQFEESVFQKRRSFQRFLEALDGRVQQLELELEPGLKRKIFREELLKAFYRALRKYGITPKETLTAERLRTITDQIETENRERALAEVKKLLRERSGNEELEIPESWGDLEPLLTLMERLKGTTPHAISPLIESIEAEENFKAYKFGPPEEPRKEIEFLSREQFDHWTRDRVELALANPENSIHEAFRERLNLVRTQVEQEGFNVDLLRVKQDVFDGREGYSELLKEVTQGRPRDILDSWVEDLDGRSDQLESILVRTIHELNHSEGKVALNYEAWARVGIAAVELLKQENFSREGVDLAEMKEGFRRIARTARFNMNELTQEGVLMMTFSSDPMLMLTVGDLVECTSCLNYKKGGMIKYLPSFVVDPGVRLLAGFHLSAKNFSTQSDYEHFYATVSQGSEAYRTRWDGNRRILHFELLRGEEVVGMIQTLPIEHGYQRNIIRLGRSSIDGVDQPSLRFENTYRHTHPAEDLMRKMRRDMFQAITDDLGASNEYSATMPNSRNPLGTYSDRFGSGKMGDFIMAPVGLVHL